ncbi:MAG: helix-turn-helix domain-containing protein [Alphaproteobacteria bacterium]|nr:helix-turn-helix domain-containing protein [Alphaproteobacteria bacterium]
MNDNHVYLTTKEAARIVGFSHRTLEGMRSRGGGPCYIELPNGRIRYRQQDLIEWIEQGLEPKAA